MDVTIIALALLFAAAAAVAIVLFLLHSRLAEKHRHLAQTHADTLARFRGVVDADAERQRVLQQLGAEREGLLSEVQRAKLEQEQTRQRLAQELESERARLYGDVQRTRAEQEQALQAIYAERQRGAAEVQSLQGHIQRLRAEFTALDEESNLQSFGFYKPRYSFASSDRYQTKLDEIRDRQKAMLSAKTAAQSHTQWTVNGSAAEGRKQINQTLKLMLRAFNGECDAAIAKVKYNNVNAMEARIRKAREVINALVTVQQCTIAPEYFDLKLQELYLVYEYEEKVQAEKEEQRRIRDQMREEEIAQREIEKARLDAEKEEARAAEALRKARAEVEQAAGAKQQKLLGQIEELERRLADAQANKQRALSQAQLTRSGHVYVISNIGSFGEHIYKIGMTRRLDPMDRIRELGDASVPFQFDVHAIIYTQDAPALESALHRTFHQRRVNRMNDRKEFFRLHLDEIATAVRQTHAGEIEFTRIAEAEEYRKTLAMGDAHAPTPPPAPAAALAAVPVPA